MEDDIKREDSELYRTAVFHIGNGNIVELVSDRAYSLSLSRRKWTLLSTTVEDSIVSKGLTVAAVCVNNHFLVLFAGRQEKDIQGRPHVWLLDLDISPSVWRLNTFEKELSVPAMFGSWSRVGNSVILSPRRAPNMEVILDEIFSTFAIEVSNSDVLEGNTVTQMQLVRKVGLNFLITISYAMLLSGDEVPYHKKRMYPDIHTVWQLDLKGNAWQPYSTSHRTSAKSRFYSISTNWEDKAFATFGSSFISDDVAVDPILSSDVWVYFLENRRWINVTILSEENPKFLLYPTITHYEGSSFLL